MLMEGILDDRWIIIIEPSLESEKSYLARVYAYTSESEVANAREGRWREGLVFGLLEGISSGDTFDLTCLNLNQIEPNIRRQ